MSFNISGHGLQLNVIASNTFPSGILVSEFADDGDPLDTPVLQIADKAMGLNGDLIYWSKATPIEVTINVVPGGDNDKELATLLEANRVGKGKNSARDKITLVAIYAGGATRTLSEGVLISGPVTDSVASAGRLKTSAYVFAFEGIGKAADSEGPGQ